MRVGVENGVVEPTGAGRCIRLVPISHDGDWDSPMRWPHGRRVAARVGAEMLAHERARTRWNPSGGDVGYRVVFRNVGSRLQD